VPGDQQGHQLVTQLGVGEAIAGLALDREQQREHVVVLDAAGLRPAAGDLFEDDLVGRGAGAEVAAPRAARAEVDARERKCAVDHVHVDHAHQRLAQTREEAGVLDPEHGAQDHLERDLLHPRAQRKRPAERPALELACRDVGDHVAIARDAASVERREHQLPHAEVIVAVEQQDRARPEDRLHELVRLAGAEHLGVAGEDLADDLRVAHVHERVERVVAQREEIAVARAAAPHVPHGVAGQLGGLGRLGEPRAGREAHGAAGILRRVHRPHTQCHHTATWRSITPYPSASSTPPGSVPRKVPNGCSYSERKIRRLS
jgi:hypothetical protein